MIRSVTLPLIVSVSLAFPAASEPEGWDDGLPVGRAEDGRVVLPVSQTLRPAGEATALPGMRPVTVAISPDGRWLATSGKTNALQVMRLDQPGRPMSKIDMPGREQPGSAPSEVELKPDRGAQISYTGLVFSSDGTRLYLSDVNGSIKAFAVGPEAILPLASWALPGSAAPGREAEIPAGLAVSPDGRRLYVCGSLSNRLHELDTGSGAVLRSIETGMVPFGVALIGNEAWVSNRAGRRPVEGDATELVGKGVSVRVEGPDALPGGSVSVVDLGTGAVAAEIEVGRQPGALVASPDGAHIVVANSSDDTLSVIEVAGRRVVGTPSVRWRADDPFGASPSALAFVEDGSAPLLLVALGTQNAVGVFDFAPESTRLRGLVPTGWFPSGVAWHAGTRTLHVSNLKGVGSGTEQVAAGRKTRTYEFNGTLSHIAMPDPGELEEQTEIVLENYGRDAVRRALLPPREGVPPVPVPERSGEPSVFKHVVYLVRENRTYDQVFGDLPQGKGEPELCTFGRRITPNAHRIAEQFVLLDNTYCSGVLSADGHNWSLSAFANEYVERSFAGWPRSYPAGLNRTESDALAWSPAGFLWSGAARAGRRVRVYGEMAYGSISWLDPAREGKPKFVDFLRDRREPVKSTTFEVHPNHASVEPFLAPDYPAWAAEISDQQRADIFINHLRRCEHGDAEWENLHILSLPNDHTSATKPGFPTPAASVADNDLALGRILEEISRSRYWPETCVVAIEDDPQNGWDHVSAYRTVCLVASPYTRRGAVVSTHYNQPGVIRTIGLMLGMPPLNQLDAASTPLRDCFVAEPDLSPYEVLVPEPALDELNPSPGALNHPKEKEAAIASSKLPLDRVDACDEDELNRILWLAMKGPEVPYPAWAILPEDQRVDDDD